MEILRKIVLMLLLVTAMIFPMATAAYADVSDVAGDLVYFLYQYLPK